MPLFSVIMPVYNAEATLAEAIRSVVHQSFLDWELIITNDGSTDSSRALMAEETKEIKHVTIIDQENAGLGAARNTAVQKASGMWLVFLDADDYWASNKLEALNRAILDHPEADVIYHPVMELQPNGLMRKRQFWRIDSTAEFLQRGNPLVPSAMAIKKSVFEKHGGFIEDRAQVEDLLLWFRLLAANTKFEVINKPLTVYRLGTGVTANLEDHLNKVFHAVEQAIAEGVLPENAKTAFEQRKFYEAARQLHKMGDFSTALTYYNRVKPVGLKQHFLQLLCKMKIAR